MKKVDESYEAIGLNQDWRTSSREWRTYVEFGAQKRDSDERYVGVHVKGQDAYDLWHLAVRYKEVLACRRLIQSNKLQIEDIPRKRKFLIFFLLLAEYHEVEAVVELGCSVFELIDGLELVKKYFQNTNDSRLNFDFKKHKFIGIDTSDLMLQAAADIHQGYNIELFNDALLFLESIEYFEKTSRALFDLNVSSYAFDSSLDLAKFLNAFDVAYVELALSQGETFLSSSYQGTPFVYFSLRELISLLDKPLYFFCEKRTSNQRWYINTLGNPVVNGFFIFGEPDRIYNFIDNARKYKEVDQYFIERGVDLMEASKLLI